MITEKDARDMLLSIDTKVRYDNLFWWFENNEFKNEGDYPRATNLVFEFSDWIEKMDDDELAERLGFFADFKDFEEAGKAASQARKEMLNGVDMWLEA